MEYAVLAGASLFGKTHGVLVPVLRGVALTPRRAKPTLCSNRRVMVNGEPFYWQGEQTCSLCWTIFLSMKETEG